ncbi:MAG TPA: glucose-6-phosphate dehydrogenase [Rhizomicrobium sp.]|nr:glucose-6-phosphate dehydrogenase [Rhizomicrobium sp.]
MVLFGANGDLTKRLVVPALYNLAKAGKLPERFVLIGVDHNEHSTDDWRQGLHDFLKRAVAKGGGEVEDTSVDEQAWSRLAAAFRYFKGDFNDKAMFARLKSLLDDCERQQHLDGNALFYLATADRFFGPLVDSLAEAGLTAEDEDKSKAENKAENKGWRRVVIEKPFGHDLESAKALNARILKHLHEEQIFRIDHFLGKETVQNIMALRFANGLFEPIWHRDRIEHVQITVAETVGVERRGNFYEQTGALRDMVPNHLFQLVAMTAMEPPSSFDAEAVRAKKAEVFRAVHPLSPQVAVRGQYDSGEIAGEPVQAYRKEVNVNPHSSVETFVALRLCIDNWRWAGVPFYLRTGKRLRKRTTEIAIRFRDAPFMLFKDTPMDALDANWLILQIQPDEGIRLRFNAKKPGQGLQLESVAMDFKYADWFRAAPAVGYETLLYDVFMGDGTLFQRADQVESSWAVVDPLLKAWAAEKPSDFPNYKAGSAGPRASDALLAADGRGWRAIR